MSVTVTGIIERKMLGSGVWALVSDTGETYELMTLPTELRKTGQKVNIIGNLRPDIMTLAMIGPVLEIESFTLIN